MKDQQTQKLKSKPLISGIDKPVSQLALGTAFYRIDDKQPWFDLLDAFVGCGGTLLDTGRQYGTSENVLGEWMASRKARDRVVLSTKCAHGDCELPAEHFEDMVTEEMGTSLKILQTDHVDLYMLHRDNPAVPVARIIDRLNVEIERGRTLALGASNWTPARVDEANRYARQHGLKGFSVVSNNVSLAVPDAPFYRGLVSLDAAAEQWQQQSGLPLIVWSSQARGFFTGRWTPEMRAHPERMANDFDRRMLEVYCTDDNFERLRRAESLGTSKGGYSAMQVALAWVLHKPFPLVPIVGPHTREELTSCVGALSLQLTEAEVQWLNLKDSDFAGVAPHGGKAR
jgi:1-deoxyxylulose-5-phosphate synthase